MDSAFLYLTFCTLRNRLRVRIKRLREPRYLIGAVIGLAYFYLVFFRPRSRGGAPAGVMLLLDRAREPVELCGALFLFVIAALAWAWPRSGAPGLPFTRADVQFLFTAPITRRQLIRYKIVRSLSGSLIGSFFMTVFFRPGSLASGWTFFLGMAGVMAILNLHLTGVALRRASLAQHGRSGWIRQAVPLGVILTAVGILGWTVARDWSAIALLETPGQVMRHLNQLGLTGLAGIVLWPFKAIVRLPLSGSAAAFVSALPGAIALVAVNYVWVMRSDASFEEASAELAEKVARGRRGARPVPTRARAASTPFALSLHGPPEFALLWKNLILVGRYASLKTLARLVPIIIILGVIFSRQSGRSGAADTVTIVCLTLGAFVTFFGPQVARNDLRQDLANLAVLKAWPIRGAALVRGEVLAPALLLTGLIWLLVVGVFSFSISAAILKSITVATRLRYAAAVMLLAPALALTQLVLQNGFAVMFPAWAAVGRPRGGGFDVMGQRLITTYGMLLVLVVAVVPAAAAGGLVGFLEYLVTRTIPVLLPALVAFAAILVECYAATALIGRMLDRTDVAAIDATET